ncbi:uncharacterized protein LOC143265401 [Megachile rotundata]|uniref:uncharacterized protein LOC143265401 n=1 Tax=Megachile rotundata TaxID=143995 RepID=UPI003FD5BDA0
MENEITWDDPQFMNFLESCLRVETESMKNTLSDLKGEIKEFKTRIQNQLQARRELKNKTKNIQENYSALTAALNKQRKYLNETSERIELMKLNLDTDYKVKKLECDQFEKICAEYEKTWQEYYAKYEDFPLAKKRKEAKIRSEKLRIDKMVIEYKLNELEKTRKLNQQVKWLRMRVKIVEFARAVSNGSKLEESLRNSYKSIRDCKEELIVVNAELEVQTRKREEEKRNRALKMLEMPPPTINFSHIRSIYGRRLRTNFSENCEKNYENSLDSISVDTVMLEEMCTTEEMLSEHAYGLNVENEADPDEEKVADMEENDEQIDAEMEQEPLNVSKDKQTVQRSEDLEVPLAKRMKLIPEASPASKPKIVRAERSQLETSGPRIIGVETIRSPMGKNLNPASGSRGSQLSLASKSRYESPAKIDQNNPNPSSMFTPRHYDYSDSNFSFCVDNSENLKDDQISLYGGSVRDLCECSNISTPLQEAEMADVEKERASTSKKSFPQFDFSNIMKGNSGRKTLF